MYTYNFYEFHCLCVCISFFGISAPNESCAIFVVAYVICVDSFILYSPANQPASQLLCTVSAQRNWRVRVRKFHTNAMNVYKKSHTHTHTPTNIHVTMNFIISFVWIDFQFFTDWTLDCCTFFIISIVVFDCVWAT